MRRGIVPWVTIRRSPYRKAFFWRYRWVSRHCVGKDVLDIPCGMGWGTSRIRGARTLVGVDLSRDAIEEATRRYGHVARFQWGNMAALDFGESSFDVVSCLEGIEHVSKEVGDRFLAECRRVLRPGGLLLLSSPYCRTMTHSGNPYHIHEYQPDEIRIAVSSNFEIEDVAMRDVDIMTVLYLRCRVKNT